MVRVRLVTTPIWSQEHLVRALAQVGFPRAESHREAVPLDSWRGTPLGASAHVVVRRDQIGAAGDDFGLVRNARGSFDAVVSEIHFNRFDRRWLEDLARRHDELAQADGRTPPSNLPATWERRELGAAPAPPPQPGVAPPPASSARTEAAAQHHVTRARAETAVALDELRKTQKKSDGPGCVLSILAPMILWIVMGIAEPGLRGGGGFFGVVLPLWILLAIVRAVRMARRARRAATELMERLPSNEAARAAALSFLETKVKPAGAKNEDALVKEFLKALREPRDGVRAKSTPD